MKTHEKIKRLKLLTFFRGTRVIWHAGKTRIYPNNPKELDDWQLVNTQRISHFNLYYIIYNIILVHLANVIFPYISSISIIYFLVEKITNLL
jgi:hypothetical protein